MKRIKAKLLIATLLMLAGISFAQTWTPTSSSSNNWVAVASSADGNKLIVGSLGAGSDGWTYCISTNSGNTWTTNAEPQKNSTYGGWSSIASSADGTIYAAIAANIIWTSTNSGTTWFSNNVPGNFFFSSVALSADGSKLVAVVGLNYSIGPIYTSTNSGMTVTPTTTPSNNWMSVASSADGSKLVAVASSIDGSPLSAGNVIYVSTNSGLTWTPTKAPTNNMWDAVASSADGSKLVAASSEAFANNYGGIYTSTNSGITWKSNNVPNAQWQSVASSADGSKLVAVSIFPTSLIYTSLDSGVTWVSNSAPNEMWKSVASSSDGNKLVAAPLSGLGLMGAAPIYTAQITPLPQLILPQLNLAVSGTSRTLSWIIPSSDFVLQKSQDLTSWTNVTTAPILNLTTLQNQVTIFPTLPINFYRLATP